MCSLCCKYKFKLKDNSTAEEHEIGSIGSPLVVLLSLMGSYQVWILGPLSLPVLSPVRTTLIPNPRGRLIERNTEISPKYSEEPELSETVTCHSYCFEAK